jgi:hypothetical protein
MMRSVVHGSLPQQLGPGCEQGFHARQKIRFAVDAVAHLRLEPGASQRQTYPVAAKKPSNDIVNADQLILYGVARGEQRTGALRLTGLHPHLTEGIEPHDVCQPPRIVAVDFAVTPGLEDEASGFRAGQPALPCRSLGRLHDLDHLRAQSFPAMVIYCSAQVLELTSGCRIGRTLCGIVPACRPVDVRQHLIAEEMQQFFEPATRFYGPGVLRSYILRVERNDVRYWDLR